MNDSAKAPMNAWVAALIGLAILFILTSLLGLDSHPGILAALTLVATAVGAYAAARLSRRAGPGWIIGAAGLLSAIAYLYVQTVAPAPTTGSASGLPIRQAVIPLWLMISLLGSPLLGARVGIGAAGRR